MIISLSGRDEWRHPWLFGRLYRKRHEVFVKRRGWRALHACTGLERDCYDTPDATYILGIGQRHTVHSAARLLPTTGPHLLDDLFPHLVDGPVPRDAEIMEITRLFVSAEAGATLRRQRMHRLSATIFEHSSALGVQRLTAVVDVFMPQILQRHGWCCEHLGEPRTYAEGTAVAIAIDVETSRRNINGPMPKLSPFDAPIQSTTSVASSRCAP